MFADLEIYFDECNVIITDRKEKLWKYDQLYNKL